MTIVRTLYAIRDEVYGTNIHLSYWYATKGTITLYHLAIWQEIPNFDSYFLYLSNQSCNHCDKLNSGVNGQQQSGTREGDTTVIKYRILIWQQLVQLRDVQEFSEYAQVSEHEESVGHSTLSDLVITQIHQAQTILRFRYMYETSAAVSVCKFLRG